MIYFIWSSIFIVVVGVVVIGLRRQKKQLLKRQLAGINVVKQINALVQLLQKHRGLSAALCGGDNSVQNELSTVLENISGLIAELAQQPFMLNNERWLSFKDHWARLSLHKKNQSAEYSFQQHTKIIANILYLLEDMAELHCLTRQHLHNFDNVGYIWRELLAVTESVGQSRAVGVRSVAAKHCSSVEKIRLKFLYQHINKVSEDTLKVFLASDKNKSLHELVEKSLSSTRLLTSTIKDDILVGESINISRRDYFDLASNTMEQLNTIFNFQVAKLAQSLH